MGCWQLPEPAGRGCGAVTGGWLGCCPPRDVDEVIFCGTELGSSTKDSVYHHGSSFVSRNAGVLQFRDGQ